LIDILRARLDALLLEPLDAVLECEEEERAVVRRLLEENIT
jgi:hypothetical protein